MFQELRAATSAAGVVLLSFYSSGGSPRHEPPCGASTWMFVQIRARDGERTRPTGTSCVAHTGIPEMTAM